MVRGRKSALLDMGQDAPPTKDRCHWPLEDEAHLIQFLTTNRAKGGDGMNFDKTVWASASIEMAKHTTLLDCVQQRASYRVRDGATESACTTSVSALWRG
jgi:hypothetical protein